MRFKSNQEANIASEKSRQASTHWLSLCPLAILRELLYPKGSGHFPYRPAFKTIAKGIHAV